MTFDEHVKQKLTELGMDYELQLTDFTVEHLFFHDGGIRFTIRGVGKPLPREVRAATPQITSTYQDAD